MSKERAEQLVEAGIWLRLSGDLDGARRLFEQALVLDPDNARAREMFDGAIRSASQGVPRPPDAAGNPFDRSTPSGTAGGYSPGSSPRPFSPGQVVNLTPSDAELRRIAAAGNPTIPPRGSGTPAPLGPGELGLDPLTPRAVVLSGDSEPAPPRKPLFTPPPVAAVQPIPMHTVLFGAQPASPVAPQPAASTLVFGVQPPAPAPSAPDPFPPVHPPDPLGPSGGRTMMFGPASVVSPIPAPVAMHSSTHTMMFGPPTAAPTNTMLYGGGEPAGASVDVSFDPDETNPYGTFPKDKLQPPPAPAPMPGTGNEVAPALPRSTLPFGQLESTPSPAAAAQEPAATGRDYVPWDLPDSGAFKVGAVTAPDAPSPPAAMVEAPPALPRPPTPVPGMRVVAEAQLLTSSPSGPGPRTINAAASLLSAAIGPTATPSPRSSSTSRPPLAPARSTPLPSVAPSIAPLADESPMKVTQSSPSRPPLPGPEGLQAPRSPTRPPIADEPPSPMVVTRTSPTRPPLPAAVPPAIAPEPSPMQVTRSSPTRPPQDEVAAALQVTASPAARQPLSLLPEAPREPIPSNRGSPRGVSGVWTAVPDAAPSRPASQPSDDAWNWGNAAVPREPEPAALELPMFPSPAPFTSPSPALVQNAESAWDQRSNPGIKLQSRESGAGMDMLARDRRTPAPAHSEPKANVASLLKAARNSLELDDHTGAMDLILKAQALAPDSPEVQQMRERSEQTLLAMYESKIGKLETKPRVLLKNDEIIWLNLDHRAGFVLAQIDGTSTFDDLFAVSGMSRFDTAKILAQMIDEGVISRG